MKVEQHPVDREACARTYHGHIADLDHFVRGARNSAPGQGLRISILAGWARTCYRFGSVVEPDSPAVGRAIVLAAQARAALFSFAGPGEPPGPFPLGEGQPVTHAAEEPPPTTWPTSGPG